MRSRQSFATTHRSGQTTTGERTMRRAPTTPRRRAAACGSAALLATCTLLLAAIAPALAQVGAPSGTADHPDPALEQAVERFAATERQWLRTAAREAVRAGADASAVAELLERARERGTDAAWVAGVLEQARRLGASRLPVAPVVDRYLQGLAKGVAPARIDAVASRLEERLRVAARHVDRVFGGRDGMEAVERERLAMIDHAGYALGAGIPDEALAATLEMVAGERLGLGEARGPVIALGCLGAAGLEPGRSRELVRSAWQHGFRGEAIEQLATAIGTVARERHDALPGLVDALLARLERGETRQAILEHLERQRHGDGPGHHPPGSGPGDDPGDMRGPGGPPDDPGHQDPHGHGGQGGQGGAGGSHQGGG
jgi:hypothetical protein